ncbi:MAG: TonB-dependent receptor [Pseudomonadota bacterium]
MSQESVPSNRYLLPLLLVLGLGIASSAAGQSPGVSRTEAIASPDRLIEETIVYGTKAGLTVQEAEVSVEIFTSERIDQENLFDLDDLLLRTPNVQSTSIRGISRFGIGGAGQGVTSNVYLDGAPFSSDALTSGLDSLWDIAQVEVLRGPQSTVQGRNALAGSIVMRTKEPGFDWESALRLRAAENDTYQLAGAISGPLIDNVLAGRLTFDYQDTNGFIQNGLTGGDNDAGENLMLRAKLLFEPEGDRDLRARLTVDYNTLDSALRFTSVAASVAANDPEFAEFDFYDFVSFTNPETRDNETLRVISDLSLRLTDTWTLEAIGTYEGNDLVRTRGRPDDPGSLEAALDEDFIINQTTDTYSAELRFAFVKGRWSGSVGAYYFEDDLNGTSEFFSPLLDSVFFPIDPIDTLVTGLSRTITTTDNYAGYAQARFDMNERWTFDLSFRYDVETYETTGAVTAEPGVSPESCVATIPPIVSEAIGVDADTISCLELVRIASSVQESPGQSDTFTAFLPRAAVTYNINDDVAVFVSAQRGYRAGGTFLQLTGEGNVAGSYDPEYLTNIEIGVRSTWFDQRLIANANVFFSTIEDQQVTVPGPSGTFSDALTINAGETELYGLEATLEYSWTPDLTLYGSLGLLETEFQDFPFATPGQPFENLAGNELPNAPNVSYTLGANYDHSSGFFANASVAYSSSQHSQIFNLTEDELGPGLTEKVGSRALANARLGYAADDFSVFLYGTNLLEEETSITAFRGQVGADSGSVRFREQPVDTTTAPRQFGVGLDMRF